ncbi:hypothetical protein CCACVL1_07646 [Corchorus capsularis]|uniref:Uncharacterized protein n=1 Tax=Corchorus capsularis TaxID=210143 RepID=A0A1R3J4L1_COCAP|nr:hypothetical protein CCACVL1_07646 [Corchorus capsularis]
MTNSRKIMSLHLISSSTKILHFHQIFQPISQQVSRRPSPSPKTEREARRDMEPTLATEPATQVIDGA